MKNSVYVFLAVLVCIAMLIPAPVFPQANIIWHNIHKGPLNNGFFPVKMAVDGIGNLYVTGTSISGTGGDMTSYLDITTLKYNSSGFLQWQKIAGNSWYNEDDGTCLAVDDENYVYVFGYSFDTITDKSTGLLLKYSPAGEELWRNTISDYKVSGDRYYNYRQIVIDSDKNIFTFWNSYPYGSNYHSTSVKILKFGSSGNLLWQIRDTALSANNYFADVDCILIDRQNNIILAGSREKYGVSGQTFLMKISKNGSVIFNKTILDNKKLYYKELKSDFRNNYFISGESDSTYVMKITPDGNLLWLRNFPKCSSSYQNYDNRPRMLVTIDGNVIASNTSTPIAGTNYIVTVKYNANGDTLWKRSYSYGTSPYNSLSSICEDNQGCIYVCGSSRGVPFIAGNFFVILKYSPSGKLLREIRNLDSSLPSYYGSVRDFILDNSGNMYMTSEVMLTQNQTYEYGLTVKYSAPVDTISENLYPSGYKLYQNYPNPFNSSTSFEFELPGNTFVNISVYNMLGQKTGDVVNGYFEKGYHYRNWNAPNLSSGIYYYIFRAGEFSEIKKMALIK